jgi:hypothetical protein
LVYVAVQICTVARTTDARNQADDFYGKQASAAWQWDASQAIGDPPNFAWDATLSKVTAPNAWSEVDDGTEPKKDGPWGNEAIRDLRLWGVN